MESFGTVEILSLKGRCMIGLLWEQEICGTLSLDLPVLAEEEIAYGTRTQRGLPDA